MMNKTQLNELERQLWAECSHNVAHQVLKDNLDTRERLGKIISLVYTVLTENRRHLRDTSRLEELEYLLTIKK